jgi:hypothetical protein
MPKTKLKVAGAAGGVKPYVERAIRDEELRDSIRNAYTSARTIYNAVTGSRSVAKVAKDKKVHRELETAIAELRAATARLQGKKKRDDHGGRGGLLLLLGVAIGVFFNPVTGPQTRRFVADKLFGGGDDFTYQGSNGSSS